MFHNYGQRLIGIGADFRIKGKATTSLEASHETFPAPATNLSERTLDGRLLRAAMDSLPPGQRQAITLLKLRDLSLKEASAVSGMSIASLKVATHRALKSLRTLLR